MSLENKKPVVYVQSLDSGRRQVLANFRGSNSAPAWSPDGRRLAVTLTKDGGSQLFLINADGSGVHRLLTSPGIDTEAYVHARRPVAAVHVRPRRHAADLPAATSRTGAVERLTFDGSYNVSPRAAPDGKGFVFVRRDGGRFKVAIQDYATRQVQVLTPGPLDESPSVAPNSQADPLRGGAGGAWYIGRGLFRRPREAAARFARHRCARARLGSALRADPVLPRPQSATTFAGDIACANDSSPHCSRPPSSPAAPATPTQEAAPVEERRAPAPPRRRRRRDDRRRSAAGISGSAPARPPGPRPGARRSRRRTGILSQAHRLLRLRQLRRQGRVPADWSRRTRSTCRPTATRVTLQGHTDERGTREYNIALGQKRADAVKKMMPLLGASEMQIETVSFGKEKPKNPGHDEAAWAENRRVDIVYVGE